MINKVLFNSVDIINKTSRLLNNENYYLAGIISAIKFNSKLMANVGSGNPDFLTNRFIIKYKSENNRDKFHEKFNKKDIKNIDKRGNNRTIDVITFDQKKKLKDFTGEIKAEELDSDIEFVQRDFLMSLSSNDLLYGSPVGDPKQ